MALSFVCEKGHSYITPDIGFKELPDVAPRCPKCFEEWLRRGGELIIADADELLIEIRELVSHAGWEIVQQKLATSSNRSGTNKIDLRVILKPIMEEVD